MAVLTRRILAGPSYGRITFQFAQLNRFTFRDDAMKQSYAEDLLQSLVRAQPAEFREDVAWYLGSIKGEMRDDGTLGAVSGRLGHLPAATPVHWTFYDRDQKQWTEDLSPVLPEGAGLVYFVVDPSTRLAGFTSLVGDNSLTDVTSALEAFLNHGQGVVDAPRIRFEPVRWSAIPVVELLAFDTWMSGLNRLTEIEIRYHLPNPGKGELIRELTRALDAVKAEEAVVRACATHPEGLKPERDPILAAPVEMFRQRYARVTAVGISAAGEVHFKMEDHLETTFHEGFVGDADELRSVVRQAVTSVEDKLRKAQTE